MITNSIQFPAFTGIKCNMMPFIQGDPASLPDTFRPYSHLVADSYLEKGEVGYLTVHESFVKAGSSQRGYNATGVRRNVHIEVGEWRGHHIWGGGGGGWGGAPNVFLEDATKVLIANSVDGTCRVWDREERDYTRDGDLSAYLERYPESDGIVLKGGQLARIGIFTPHECIPQAFDSRRQFFRIVGKGVHGREPYFTTNPLLN